jgi:hypothetical protein
MRGHESSAAKTYHDLGNLAQKRHDFASAEKWYRKSLVAKEKLGDEHGAAVSYVGLGTAAGAQGKFLESVKLLMDAVLVFVRQRDKHLAVRAAGNLMIFYRAALPEDREKFKVMWQEAGSGKFLPEDT